MSDVLLTIECDAPTAAGLRPAIEAQTGDQVSVFKRNDIDASWEVVLMFINTGAGVIAALTPLLTPVLSNIKKIRLGEHVIENPTPDQLKTMMRQYEVDDQQ
jgi:hypothetical protein